MNRQLRRVFQRKIKRGRMFGSDPHTGRFGDLGSVILQASAGVAGVLTLVRRNSGRMEWIPERDVFDLSSVNL